MVALRSFISKLRSSLSYGNVMATVAVFLALSGTGAYAAKKLKFKLPVNSVLSSHIRDGQVGSADLADGAVRRVEDRCGRGRRSKDRAGRGDRGEGARRVADRARHGAGLTGA